MRMNGISLLPWLVHCVLLFVWLGLCAWQDLSRREVDNWLSLGGCAAALGWLLLTGQSWLGAPPADATFAALLALLFTVPGYLLRRLGAADVKLLVALALASNDYILLGTFIGAGVASLLWALLAPSLWPGLPARGKVFLNHLSPLQPKKKYPFVPFLTVGAMISVVALR